MWYFQHRYCEPVHSKHMITPYKVRSPRYGLKGTTPITKIQLSNQPYSYGLGEGPRAGIKKPMASHLATGNITCCRFEQGLLGYTNCHVNMWQEMKWTLKHTEIGHLSIIGSFFERLEWTWSAFGHEVMSMENKCQWMSSLTLYLVNDSSSKWDKNWTTQKFITKHYTTDDVFWVLGVKISKCSQLFVLLAFIFSLITSTLASQ